MSRNNNKPADNSRTWIGGKSKPAPTSRPPAQRPMKTDQRPPVRRWLPSTD